MKNLNKLLTILIDSKIDFVLVGGYAGVVHGSNQLTRDLDICAALTENDVKALRTCLKDLSPKHRMNPQAKHSFLDHPEDIKDLNAIYLETDLGILDIIKTVTAVGDYGALKKDAVTIELFGRSCSVISLDHLIAVKEKMARDKDKSILKELYALRDRQQD